MKAVNWLCGWYGRMLYLYPARYREAYREERQMVFQMAAAEASGNGRAAFLWFALRELMDLPAAALIEHLRERRWVMLASVRTLLSEEPDPWGRAFLAGLPHVLFALTNFWPNLLRLDIQNPSPGLIIWFNWMTRFPVTHWALNLTAPDSYWMPQRVLYQTGQWLFGVLVIFMVLAGGMSRWPRWSASWVGYALIVLLTSFIGIFSQDVESLISILVWFALAIPVYVSLTRRSPLMGLMAFLPFYPMLSWLLAADGILGIVPETVGYLAAASLMSLVVAAFTRAGSFKLAFVLLAALLLVAGGGFAYLTVYMSNMPNPAIPAPGQVVVSTLGGFVAMLLVGLPVWIAILWMARKRVAKHEGHSNNSGKMAF